MVSPTRTVPNSPLTPQSALSAQPKPAALASQPLPQAKPDQFESASPATAKAASIGAAKPAGSAPRFGSNAPAEKPGWIRSTLSTTLSVGSGLALIPAIPLGLGQMALGILLHPLLITGAITLALPVLGLIAGRLLHK